MAAVPVNCGRAGARPTRYRCGRNKLRPSQSGRNKLRPSHAVTRNARPMRDMGKIPLVFGILMGYNYSRLATKE